MLKFPYKTKEWVKEMAETNLKVIIQKLEKLFEKFNNKFYDGLLVKPIITVSPDATRYGWCTSWKAWENKEDKNIGYYEINISAEYLARPFKEICTTLLHEMVHLWNLQNKIKDTSREGHYHNKKFKIAAESHGLLVEQHSVYGWCLTSLNDQARAFIIKLNEDDFKICRKKTHSQSSSRKYVCPCCGLIIRATRDVFIICGNCNVALKKE